MSKKNDQKNPDISDHTSITSITKSITSITKSITAIITNQTKENVFNFTNEQTYDDDGNCKK
jgi:hypothetical protein